MAQPMAKVFLDQVTTRLRRGLEVRISDYAEHGRSFNELGSADELAARMLQAVPAVSRWNDVLGPFYGTPQVAKMCGGISRQALADRRERRTILGLKTADGVVVYPAFQFDAKNQILRGMPEVLQSFRGIDVDDWTIAGWLVSPSRVLEGRSVVEWLRQGRDLEPAVTLARDAARRFSE
ncbi:MAG TPA: hypothetical protein VN851_08380 [Thermoanaerobaculia bacterium]|nr:hypothetical protein [Thermoanaerobaculia bacterium]